MAHEIETFDDGTAAFFTARTIRPEDIGVGFILAEGGIPRRFKAAYLTDSQIRAVIATALRRRGHNPAA